MNWLNPLATRRWQDFIKNSSILGLILGFFCLYVAYVPMLLPRAWWLQGISGGLNAIFGYGVGVIVGFLGDCLANFMIRGKNRSFKDLPIVIFLGGVIGALGVAIYHYNASTLIAHTVQLSPPTVVTVLGALLISLVLWWGVVVLVRLGIQGISKTIETCTTALAKPVKWLIKGLVFLVLGIGLVVLSRDYVWQEVVEKVAYEAQNLNGSNPQSLVPPTSPYKSGFESSSQSQKPAQQWQALGHYGQRFVSLGVSEQDITRLTQLPAIEPIRVFVGLNHQEPDKALLNSMVKTALAEMDRTQAFKRQYILVQGATGRGWIQEYSVQTVEYLTQGDVATVVVQYSYLPSQFSFLLGDDLAVYANRLLIETIQQRLAQMPPTQRPKLLLAGESLGAYASQSPFNEAKTVIHQIDGAVWIGTPRFSPLWENIVQQRDTGSTEALPMIDAGRHIRFMDSPEALHKPTTTWQSPRIVFLQYATDPIVWWSPDMLWRQPDWMKEPKGRGVAYLPKWLPVLSFWELSLDMPASNQTSAGFGHIYEDDIVYAWAKVLDSTHIDPRQVAERIEQRLQVTEYDK